MEIASRLFARCYEYRDEIRDELEYVVVMMAFNDDHRSRSAYDASLYGSVYRSSLAYVADAGRPMNPRDSVMW